MDATTQISLFKEITDELAPPSVSHNDLIEASKMWNQMATEVALPQIQRLTEHRKSQLRLRLRECGGIDGWAIALEKIKSSTFLRGENNRRWKASFDFALKQSRFTALMEGAYDTDDQSAARSSSIMAAFDEIKENTHG